ncbi:MAG TPA: SIS domain-containing protein [Methylomirabilota bacterium]|nr:SIS domain-containing protein [Methylomirabilota bacterium]
MPWTSPPARRGHPYHMHDAIYAQPGALRLVMRPNAAAAAAAAGRLRDRRHVWLAGIGTSWHAALVGELLFARAGGLGARARAAHSFELTRYWPPVGADSGVVVVSHRGSKRYSAEALAGARAAGAVSVAVTGKDSEGLAEAEHRLVTVEQEASGAHTVSYTCALAVLAALAAEIGGDAETARALDGLPDLMALLLGQESWEELAARFGERRRFLFVGGGPNTATALEAALKMNEAAHASAAGFNCEQFLHGPWAAMEPDDLLVLVAPPGPAHERCVDAARVAREIGTPVLALVAEGDARIGRLAAETIALPEVPELLSPILAVVPLQLFTYHVALRRGANPDTMRADEPAHGRARAALSL